MWKGLALAGTVGVVLGITLAWFVFERTESGLDTASTVSPLPTPMDEPEPTAAPSRSLADIAMVADDFERNAGLYDLIADASAARIEGLLGEVPTLPSTPHRYDVARVLYIRFAALDPQAAVDHVIEADGRPSWIVGRVSSLGARGSRRGRRPRGDPGKNREDARHASLHRPGSAGLAFGGDREAAGRREHDCRHPAAGGPAARCRGLCIGLAIGARYGGAGTFRAPGKLGARLGDGESGSRHGGGCGDRWFPALPDDPEHCLSTVGGRRRLGRHRLACGAGPDNQRPIADLRPHEVADQAGNHACHRVHRHDAATPAQPRGARSDPRLAALQYEPRERRTWRH